MTCAPRHLPLSATFLLSILLGTLTVGDAQAQSSADAASSAPTPPPGAAPLAPPALTDCLRSAPDYPAEARRKDMEGRNLVLFTVAADGVPGLPTILRSSGHAPLDAAALKHVQGCLAPYRHLPSPGLQPGRYGVPMEFRLE